MCVGKNECMHDCGWKELLDCSNCTTLQCLTRYGIQNAEWKMQDAGLRCIIEARF